MKPKNLDPIESANWEGDERAKILAFRALSATDKIRAVEQLNETAACLLKRADERRGAKKQ